MTLLTRGVCVRAVAKAQQGADKAQPAPRAPPAAGATRRELLSYGAGLAALSLGAAAPPARAEELSEFSIPVSNLTAFQRGDQRKAFQAQLERQLRGAITAEDHPATLRLVLLDAATYDIESGTGGVNGSIVTSEELGREENRSVRGIVDKLRRVKESFDADSARRGREPISWADLEVAAAKVAAEQAFVAAKFKKIGNRQDSELISSAFGASFPLQIGRVDAKSPDPAGRVPRPDASVDDIVAFLATLGTKKGTTGGFFGPKALFWEGPAFVLWTAAQDDPAAAEEAWVAANPKVFGPIKTKYDRSRQTVTRTDYEVDFIDYFTALASKRVGASFNPDAYLTPLKGALPKLF